MKLTNAQTSVLVRTMWSKIQDKLESLRSTPEYDKAVDTAKITERFDDKLEYVIKYAKLGKQLESIKQKRESLKDEYDKRFKIKSYWSMPTKETLVSELDEAAIKILAKDLPTKEDLEADIILTAMSPGASDILTALTTKYDL